MKNRIVSYNELFLLNSPFKLYHKKKQNRSLISSLDFYKTLKINWLIKINLLNLINQRNLWMLKLKKSLNVMQCTIILI